MSDGQWLLRLYAPAQPLRSPPEASSFLMSVSWAFAVRWTTSSGVVSGQPATCKLDTSPLKHVFNLPARIPAYIYTRDGERWTRLFVIFSPSSNITDHADSTRLGRTVALLSRSVASVEYSRCALYTPASTYFSCGQMRILPTRRFNCQRRAHEEVNPLVSSRTESGK